MNLRMALLCSLMLSGISGFVVAETQHLKISDHMSATQFQRAGLNKLSVSELASLDEWFSNVSAEFRSKGCPAESSKSNNSEASLELSEIEGAVIMADDGQFLGKITTNSIDSQSIINDIGRYGSSISSTSIRNNISRYGSSISSLSAFNNITSTPPRIFKNGKFIGYLTTNTIKTPRIDPRMLIGWLESEQ